jgi:hypothetical protein
VRRARGARERSRSLDRCTDADDPTPRSGTGEIDVCPAPELRPGHCGGDAGRRRGTAADRRELADIVPGWTPLVGEFFG